MSARNRIISMAVQTGCNPYQSQRAAERLLDAYRDDILREAAAKIRAEAGEECCIGHPQPEYGCGAWEGERAAADLIDPDKEQL